MGDQEPARNVSHGCFLWLVAFLAALPTTYFVYSFMTRNLIVRSDWAPSGPRPSRFPSDAAAPTLVRDYCYWVEFCGVVLDRDDNPDGRDLLPTIRGLQETCWWVSVSVALVSGGAVGGCMTMLPWMIGHPRRDDAA